VFTYFRDGFGHSYYGWYFVAIVLGGLASLPFNLFSIYYAASIGMDVPTYGRCIALTYACSLVLSYPLGILADRFHPLRVTIVALALYAVVMACGGFLVRDSSTFFVALLVHGVVSGSMFTAWASLPQRLLPREKFAEIGSLGGVLQAISIMLLAPALGKFLDYTNRDYRSTFYLSCLLTLLALAAFTVLHFRFMALGGPKHYVAPL
jgi:nitrate/nitrite transporter NarK